MKQSKDRPYILVVAENGYRGQIASDLLAKIPDVLKQYERA